ncbi:uncharacterized protein LOC108032883 [Drosophila biarmipes]|uniref:uncharacterized protein LOC108032883 n=1 Tax=Drosophila biarmipes TaxID=125945 RepID=UPI0007E5F106|nr:uncharacterized protein LOC108032883 [Drosophila biarmipes]
MKLHLPILFGLLGLTMVHCQILLPGLRHRQIPVLDRGQIRVVQYLDAASTVTPEVVRDQFSRRFTTLAKPLINGAAPQTSLPNL